MVVIDKLVMGLCMVCICLYETVNKQEQGCYQPCNMVVIIVIYAPYLVSA